MQPPPNELYTTFSFIGFVMCAIPMYWHLQARNIGTCLFMTWTGLGCLIQCINSIVWNKNMINRAPVYCDIVIHIQIGLSSAILACFLCINRRLYKITTHQGGMDTREEKRRGMIVDLLIGLGIPILQMVAQYVVSGCRYLIFEDFGPYHCTVPNIPAPFLVAAWPVMIGSVSLVYCVRSIYHLYKRQSQLSEMISFGCGLNRSFYIRLMILAGVEILGTIPLASFFIAMDIKQGLEPWVSWADVHSNYSVIAQVPSIFWKHNLYPTLGLEMSHWVLVLCAFIFFAFFGFGEEALHQLPSRVQVASQSFRLLHIVWHFHRAIACHFVFTPNEEQSWWRQGLRGAFKNEA
ncbi:GPCR fungal pheromone mating factor [Lactifluus subvellereus]|nr:GPCR fungal pheromone mating factor [Lactifluus subvellereus]